MLTLDNFTLFQAAVGTTHTRAFSVRNTGGVIADYVLGELGREQSPFPKLYYSRITQGQDDIQLFHPDTRNRLQVGLDRALISIWPPTPSEDANIELAIEQAMHILPGIYTYLNEPKLKAVDLSWSFYSQKIPQGASLLDRPPSKHFAEAVLGLERTPRLSLADFVLQTHFRSQSYGGFLNEKDYIQISFILNQLTKDQVWPPEAQQHQTSEDEADTFYYTVQISVQHVFKPVRAFSKHIIEGHYGRIKDTIWKDVTNTLDRLNFQDRPVTNVKNT